MSEIESTIVSDLNSVGEALGIQNAGSDLESAGETIIDTAGEAADTLATDVPDIV